MVIPIPISHLALRQRIQHSLARQKALSWNRLLTTTFCICLVLFTRALSGYGEVKGHALVHCPLLSSDHRYLPIALIHEGKIAELHHKINEEERNASRSGVIDSSKGRGPQSVGDGPANLGQGDGEMNSSERSNAVVVDNSRRAEDYPASSSEPTSAEPEPDRSTEPVLAHQAASPSESTHPADLAQSPSTANTKPIRLQHDDDKPVYD